MRFFLFFVFFSSVTIADDWTVLIPDHLEFDADSVKKIDNDLYSLTWRSRYKAKGNYTQYSGNVDCSLLAINLSKEVDVESDPILRMGPYVDFTYDFKNGYKGYLRTQIKDPLTFDDKIKQFKYPVLDSYDGKILDSFCTYNPELFNDSKKDVDLVKGYLNCKNNQRDICFSDSISQKSLLFYFFRLQQINKACKITDNESHLIVYDLISSLNDDRNTINPVDTIGLKLYGFSEDLSRVQMSSSCEYVPMLINEVLRTNKLKKDYKDIGNCIALKIPILDDGISDAKNIANAIYDSCSLAVMDKINNDVKDGLMGTIIENILKSRATKKIENNKNTPKPKSLNKARTYSF